LIEAVPPGTDPSASWSPRLWSLFSRLQRPGESAGPLNALFDRAWETWRGAMDVRERRRLEDALADVLGRENPRLALAWMDRFAQAEADALRAQQWKMKRGELLLYRLGDLDGAERFFRAVSPDAYPLVVRAQVRVGDIALLRGNLAEAQALYAAAGARSGRAEPPPKGLPDGAVAAQVPAAGPIAWPAPSQTGSATGFSARVRALIGVARYDDALRLLDEWELTSPAEKISGDFILLEATALVADGDAARADRMLAAYCGVAPESPILIQAVEMRKTCMERLGEPPAGIKAFEERVRKRTSGAPVRGSPRKDNER
jgi:tetratricopeptide (TPR) repeat protein